MTGVCVEKMVNIRQTHLNILLVKINNALILRLILKIDWSQPTLWMVRFECYSNDQNQKLSWCLGMIFFNVKTEFQTVNSTNFVQSFSKLSNYNISMIFSTFHYFTPHLYLNLQSILFMNFQKSMVIIQNSYLTNSLHSDLSHPYYLEHHQNLYF